jgi:hypothetical protein
MPYLPQTIEVDKIVSTAPKRKKKNGKQTKKKSYEPGRAFRGRKR